MARKTPSRLTLRREAEAAAAADATKKKTSKTTTKKKKKTTKRTTTKTAIRKRLVWGVYSSSMKEEARFPYSERKAADQKAEKLSTKNKRTYFVQPIKEEIAIPVPEDKEE